MRYRALVKATFYVEFEDDKQFALVDQAHDAAIGIIDESALLDLDVREVILATDEVAA